MAKAKAKKARKRAMPYLAAALICEKTLSEEKVVSAIRIVDTLFLSESHPKPEPGTPIEFDLAILIMFKTGNARGTYHFRMNWITPSDKNIPAAEHDIEFKGDPNSGYNLRLPVRLKWEKEGLYWYELVLDGTTLTRIPLRVTWHPAKQPAKKS